MVGRNPSHIRTHLQASHGEVTLGPALTRRVLEGPQRRQGLRAGLRLRNPKIRRHWDERGKMTTHPREEWPVTRCFRFSVPDRSDRRKVFLSCPFVARTLTEEFLQQGCPGPCKSTRYADRTQRSALNGTAEGGTKGSTAIHPASITHVRKDPMGLRGYTEPSEGG